MQELLLRELDYFQNQTEKQEVMEMNDLLKEPPQVTP